MDAPSGRLAMLCVLLLTTPFVKPTFSNVSGEVTSQHSCDVEASLLSLLLLLLLGDDDAIGNSSLCALMGLADG